MTMTAEPQVRQPSKFFQEAMERLNNAPPSYLTEAQRNAFREIELELDGAVYSGDPLGRYPNADFDDYEDGELDD